MSAAEGLFYFAAPWAFVMALFLIAWGSTMRESWAIPLCIIAICTAIYAACIAAAYAIIKAGDTIFA